MNTPMLTTGSGNTATNCKGLLSMKHKEILLINMDDLTSRPDPTPEIIEQAKAALDAHHREALVLVNKVSVSQNMHVATSIFKHADRIVDAWGSGDKDSLKSAIALARKDFPSNVAIGANAMACCSSGFGNWAIGPDALADRATTDSLFCITSANQ